MFHRITLLTLLAILLFATADAAGQQRGFSIGSLQSHDEIGCTPLVPEDIVQDQQQSSGSNGRPLRLLPIHGMFSSNIADFAGNLVESLLASFQGGNTTKHGRARLTTPFYGDQAADGSSCEGDGTTPENYGGLTNQLAFDGLCVDMHFTSREKRRKNVTESTNTTEQQISKSGGNRKPGKTATSGSASYYGFLKLKLDYFSAVVRRRSNASSPSAAPYEALWDSVGSDEAKTQRSRIVLTPWVLLIDTDAQVFQGWDAFVSRKMRCPSWRHQQGNNFVPDSIWPRLSGSAGAGSDGSPTNGSAGDETSIDIFFQRESSKLINSGTILANGASPGVQCLFAAALTRFQPRKGGDQTALQKVLSSNKGWCTPPSKQEGGPQGSAPPTKVKLFHSVFRRDTVNAAVITAQMEVVLVHHAHMSGGFKHQNLNQVRRVRSEVLVKQADSGTPRQGFSSEALLHSGCFIASNGCSTNGEGREGGRPDAIAAKLLELQKVVALGKMRETTTPVTQPSSPTPSPSSALVPVDNNATVAITKATASPVTADSVTSPSATFAPPLSADPKRKEKKKKLFDDGAHHEYLLWLVGGTLCLAVLLLAGTRL